jgi:hypothetical protein
MVVVISNVMMDALNVAAKFNINDVAEFAVHCVDVVGQVESSVIKLAVLEL